MPTSPTQRTIKALKDRGMSCGVVERFNRFGGTHGIRIDLFGFIDLIALDMEHQETIGVQCCGGSGYSEHLKRILNPCRDIALRWLYCGNVIELWAWRKVKVKREGKAMRWEPRVKRIELEDLLP